MRQGRAQKTAECAIDELFDAAASGDVPAISSLLDQRTVDASALQWRPRQTAPRLRDLWPGWRAEAEYSALHCAAEAGHAAAVRVLLHRGVAPSMLTRNGLTPLHLAAAMGHVDVAGELMAAMDVSRSRSRSGCEGRELSPLHLACCAEDREAGAAIAGALLLAGATPHVLDRDARTPLHYAGATRNAGACAHLLAAGAWLQRTDGAALTPLALVVGSGWGAGLGLGDAGRLRAVRELRWVPAVRMLWLGHLSPRSDGGGEVAREGEAFGGGDASGGGASGGEGGALRSLTRDLVRLIASFVIASHCDDVCRHGQWRSSCEVCKRADRVMQRIHAEQIASSGCTKGADCPYVLFGGHCSACGRGVDHETNVANSFALMMRRLKEGLKIA